MVAEEGPNPGPSSSHNVRESLQAAGYATNLQPVARAGGLDRNCARHRSFVRSMGIARRLIVVLCLIGVVCAAPGSAATNPRAVRRPAVLHPRFRLVANDVVSVAASARYLVFTTPGFFAALIDRRTGARRAIEPPDCPGGAAVGFGGPWVAFSCPPLPSEVNAYSYAPRVALYDLARHRWTTRDIAFGSGICDPDDAGEGHVQAQCSVGAVGSRWLEFYATQMCDPPDYPCGSPINGSFLANLDTGAVRRDPAMAAGRVIADLDNRSGAQRLCAPLRVPQRLRPDRLRHVLRQVCGCQRLSA